jgi:hypothetical protein
MEDWAVRGGWLSTLAALLLAGSLVLKLAVHDVSVEGDQRVTAAALAGSLAGQGYSAAIPRAEVPVVAARRGYCSFTARVLDPHATYHDTELLKLPRGWSVAYVWRGAASRTLPRLGPLTEYFIARELGRIGLPAARAPVVMVLLQPACPPPDAAALGVREALGRTLAR